MAFFRPTPAANPEGKTLVFHIGDHKAGSTSIQNAFATRRIRLEGHSLFYQPQLNHNYLLKPHAGKGHVLRRGAVAQLARDVTTMQEDIAVVSAESFEGLTPARFRDMLNTHFKDFTGDIRIVVYVRPHAARFLSSYAERVKIGVFSKGLKAFARQINNNDRLRFMPRLSAWQAEFPDQLVVRPLIRSELHNGDVLEDFIKVGLGDMAYHIDPLPQANESLSLEDLLIVRLVQERLADTSKALRHAVGWELARTMGARNGAVQRSKLQLPRDLAQDLAETYDADARALDQAFFEGQPLMQTELKKSVAAGIKEPQSLALSDHFSKSELRHLRAMADTMALMLKHDEATWAPLFRQKRIEVLHEAPEPARNRADQNSETAG